MPEFKDILKEANPNKFEHLLNEPETQKIFSLLSRKIGKNLEKAAEQAAQGDTAQLTEAIKQLMKDPEGARLIQEMKSKLK